MRRFALIFGSGAFALGFGCSIFVDSSGLSGAPVADASDEPDVVNIANPEVDAGDAGIDGGCDATFCDGFDEAPLGAKWTSQYTGLNTFLGVGAPSLSSPNALHVKLLNAPTSADAKAFLSRTLGKGSGFRCEVNMFIVQRTTGQTFTDIFRVRTTTAGVHDYVLNLGFATGAGGSFREDLFHDDGTCECPRTGQDPPKVESSKWVHVVLESDYQTATATFDGVKEVTLVLANAKPTSDLKVELGLQGHPSTAADVLYDDLVCRLSP